MTDDPFLELVCDALGLMNRACINLNTTLGSESVEPSGIGIMCEELVAHEFYHQFRKMWDRGIPVGIGLGHLIFRHVCPLSFGIDRLGEGGLPNGSYAVFDFIPSGEYDHVGFRALELMGRQFGYRYPVAVVVGRDRPETVPGVVVIWF